jgi:cytochrome c oxidase subunit 1
VTLQFPTDEEMQLVTCENVLAATCELGEITADDTMHLAAVNAHMYGDTPRAYGVLTDVVVGEYSSSLASAAASEVLVKVSLWGANQLIPGWAFITPYTSRVRFTAVGKVDIALIVVFVAGLGSVFSAVNYVITYRCISAPIFKNRKEMRSFFVDSLLVASRIMLAINPALLIAILFLLSDRHLNTCFFDFAGGGDAVLFQHLFWFFGHPEVYVIIIPCFGFVNSLLPHLLRKRLSGRLSLQFSMYTIGFMSFAVWGHHMYMVGLANTTRTLYSTMTVMISVPASTKVLH